MKYPVLQSIAIASLAAGSMGSAQASLTSPSFKCFGSDPSLGGIVSWTYSSASAPTLSFDFFDNSSIADISSNFDCIGGGFSEGVSARKSGEGQKDFLKITLKEVFAPGFKPASAIDTHIKFGVIQTLGTLIDDVQNYDTYWNITGDYVLDDGDVQSTQFLGVKLQTTQKFDGLSSVEYDYKKQELLLSAELPQSEGVVSFTSSPFTVDEPGTLVLLGTGLLGAAALRRRRRGW